MRFLLLLRSLVFIAPAIFWTAAPFPKPLRDSPEKESEEALLIVFTQVAKDSFFIQNSLPKIRDLAAELGIPVEVHDVTDGLPAEITSSPAVLFQNYRGRSLYAGRYVELSTIKNFIRTSRRFPQQSVDNCRTLILAAQNGRTRLAAPIKITELKGKRPKGFSEEQFSAAAQQALASGLQNFRLKDSFCLQKSDRTFYMDFHPFRDKEGQLLLSAELYCQFSCIESIWSNFSQPAKGDFENFPQLFAQLGQKIEAVIFHHLQQATNGDALSMISNDVPIKSWEALNIVLPEAPDNWDLETLTDFELPKEWVFSNAVDDNTPLVQFRFPEPLERYSGEVKTLSGTLTLSDQSQLSKGQFEVATASMTMGMASLDAKVLSQYIKADKFPKASFRFIDLKNLPALSLGQTATMSVRGNFEMMNIQRLVDVATQITPLLDDRGQARLQVEASFSLNITDDFHIKGPDGPDPARKTLLFNLNFLMKPLD